MSSANWLAKKITPQQQPRGLVLRPREPVAPQPQHVPQQPQPQHHEPAPMQQHVPASPNDLPPTAEIHMGDAIKVWKGGEAHRREGHLQCPSCGSATGYTAYSGGGGQIGGHQPRPHCFECGYNGTFMQGQEANWV